MSITSVPDDILFELFMAEPIMILVLRAVCKRWRDIIQDKFKNVLRAQEVRLYWLDIIGLTAPDTYNVVELCYHYGLDNLILDLCNRGSERALGKAAKTGKANVVFSAHANGVHISQEMRNIAAFNGHLEILSIGFPFESFDYIQAAQYAALNGQHHVLDWLIAHNSDALKSIAGLAIAYCDRDILEYCVLQGFKFKEADYLVLLWMGHTDICYWLKLNGAVDHRSC